MLCACGGTDPMSTSDAGAERGAVTVTVTRAGVPLANVRVYFLRTDSTVIATESTDPAGVATAEVEAGSLVTVMMPSDPPLIRAIATLGGIQPGDAIVVGSPARTPLSLTLSIPKDPGAASYELHSSCGSSFEVADSDTGAIELEHGNCAAPLDFLVVSLDGTGAPLRALYAPGQLPVSDQLAISGTYGPMRTATLAYTNVPADTARLDVRYRLGQPDRPVFGAFASIESFPGGAATTDLTVPDASLGVVISERLHDGRSVHGVLDRIDVPSASRSVDFEGLRLPGFATPPAHDRTTGRISWTPEASALAPDFAFAYVLTERDDQTVWSHTVVTPYSGSEIVVPGLPVEDFDYNPRPGDDGGPVELVIAKVPGGFEAVRERYLETLNPFTPLVPPAGERTLAVEPDPL
jgi:hypothetical protein